MRSCLALLAALALPACAYDVEDFAVAPQGDAGLDATDASGADVSATDTAVASDTAVTDTASPPDDASVIAATCKAKGTAGTCLTCCGDRYPKGQAAVVKHASGCLCSAPACASACNSTFCKPGAPKTPDGPCGDCLRGALDGACSAETTAARADDPQVTPYLGCTSGCP